MSPHFLPQPHLEPIPDSKPDMWVLVEDYDIILPVSEKRLRIYAGFVTDGASVPRLIRRITDYQPFSPSTMAPALVHDAITRARLFARRVCDVEFFALMQMNGETARRRSRKYFFAVRIGGWWPWIHHRRRGIQQMRQLVEILDNSNTAGNS